MHNQAYPQLLGLIVNGLSLTIMNSFFIIFHSCLLIGLGVSLPNEALSLLIEKYILQLMNTNTENGRIPAKERIWIQQHKDKVLSDELLFLCFSGIDKILSYIWIHFTLSFE